MAFVTRKTNTLGERLTGAGEAISKATKGFYDIQNQEQANQRANEALQLQKEEAARQAETWKQQAQLNEMKLQEASEQRRLAAEGQWYTTIKKFAGMKPEKRKIAYAQQAEKLNKISEAMGKPMPGELMEETFTKSVDALGDNLGPAESAITAAGEMLNSRNLNKEKFAGLLKQARENFSQASMFMPDGTFGEAFAQIDGLEKRYDKLYNESQDRALTRERIEKSGGTSSNDTRQLFKLTQQGTVGKLGEMSAMANAFKQNIETFAENPSGYSDYGTLMTSLKSLQGDTSVVREAELKLGKNATSIINKAANTLQSAIDGKTLQPEQRKQIIEVMRVLAESYDNAFEKVARPIYEQTKAAGVPPEQVFTSEMLDRFAPKQKAPVGQEQPGQTPPPPATPLNKDDFLKGL